MYLAAGSECTEFAVSDPRSKVANEFEDIHNDLYEIDAEIFEKFARKKNEWIFLLFENEDFDRAVTEWGRVAVSAHIKLCIKLAKKQQKRAGILSRAWIQAPGPICRIAAHRP
jgi:hypothetical protein